MIYNKAEQLNLIKQKVLASIPPNIGQRTIDNLFTMSKCGEKKASHCNEMPLALLVVQGQKLLNYGIQEFKLSPGTLLVSGVETPASSCLVDATAQNPFLAVYFFLNRHIIADLLLHMPHPPAALNYANVSGAWAETANSIVLDAFLRLVYLCDKPRQVNILGPLILTELHFLILDSPQGYRLREIYMRGGRDGRIINVINWLKTNLSESISMMYLAHMAHMSLSSFHRHFKELTGHSPLQYIKKMRLFEAQRLMLADQTNAAEAAIKVGYESITQFNREYRRLFGEPPARNIARLRKKLSK